MKSKSFWLTILLVVSFMRFAYATESLPINPSVTMMKSTAVFYAMNPPVDLLGQFQRVIVESDNIRPDELNALHSRGARVFAYLSIGEVSPSRKWYKQVQPEWILGRNNVWDSEVLDLTNPAWQAFLLDTLVEPLAKKGYDGLFLDTLDSYYLYSKNQEERQRQARALADILKMIKQRYPQMRLIANRGFEAMPTIAPLLEAVVVESLYASWDNANKTYQEANPEGRIWLLQQIEALQRDYDMEIIIIDYLPASRRDEARRLAKRIREKGFVPWISNPELNSLGVGLIEPAPNTFLLLFDSRIDGQRPMEIPALRTVQQVLQQHNYALKWHDIQSGLPQETLRGRYAGIMVSNSVQSKSANWQDWLQKQQNDGVYVRLLRRR